MARFNLLGFLWRWVVALVLVFATFNPTEYSYYNWVVPFDEINLPLKALAGVCLLVVYVIFLRATLRSIGMLGLILAVAFFAAGSWVLIDYGLLDPEQTTVMTWFALAVLGTILGVGISWSHVRRRVTGQADMDDLDR